MASMRVEKEGGGDQDWRLLFPADEEPGISGVDGNPRQIVLFSLSIIEVYGPPDGIHYL
jgi:hypothetical protein